MFVIARELKGGPPDCECANCSKGPPRPVIRVILNEWTDFRMGAPWPNKKLVKALGKSLDLLPGESSEQYVALWYQRGDPVMGRIWHDGGKIAANFAHGGNEYKEDVGSLQVLYELSDAERGFDYGWIPFPEAASPDTKDWSPVLVSHQKGKISSDNIKPPAAFKPSTETMEDPVKNYEDNGDINTKSIQRAEEKTKIELEEQAKKMLLISEKSECVLYNALSS